MLLFFRKLRKICYNLNYFWAYHLALIHSLRRENIRPSRMRYKWFVNLDAAAFLCGAGTSGMKSELLHFRGESSEKQVLGAFRNLSAKGRIRQVRIRSLIVISADHGLCTSLPSSATAIYIFACFTETLMPFIVIFSERDLGRRGSG